MFLLLYGIVFLLTVSDAALSVLDRDVHFDNRSMWIDNKRQLLLSGAVHYARVLPGDWERVFLLAKELGLNTIQTYVMWNFHEPKRGAINWSDRADLPAFLALAHKHNLFIALRIGPYVCGEYYFGGIPVWLRSVDGVKCFRCSDPVWKRETQQWVQTVVDNVREYLADQGGPVIMLQIENEYNGKDMDYLKWTVAMALNTSYPSTVPWNLCHDHAKCQQVNTDPKTGKYSFQALCTINGFWMEEFNKDPSQPSPKWLADLRIQNPGQPAIWTEDQGWFDQWGVAQRIRRSNDQLYGIARFIAYGGSWHNFYMLTGGSNFGLQAGGEVVTAYAPDTVIDYLLLKHQPRFDFYAKFFKTLQNYSSDLLDNPIATAHRFPTNWSQTEATVAATLGHCTDDDPSHVGTLDTSQQWVLTEQGQLRNTGNGLCVNGKSAKPVTMVKCNTDPQLLWTLNTSTQHISTQSRFPCQKSTRKGQLCHYCFDSGSSGSSLTLWDCKQATESEQENQHFMYNQTQHGWRSYTKQCVTAGSQDPGWAEYHEYGQLAFLSNLHSVKSVTVQYRGHTFKLNNHSVVLVDIPSMSILMDTSTEPIRKPHVYPATILHQSGKWQWYQEVQGAAAKEKTSKGPTEQLLLTDNDSDYLWYETDLPESVHSLDGFKAKTASGTILYPAISTDKKKLQILSCAMGLSNGGVGPGSLKGIVGTVSLGGHSLTNQMWTHRWIIPGENLKIFTPSGQGNVTWKPVADATVATKPLIWFKATFDMPSPVESQLNVDQTAYAVDLSSMWKGAAYFNGFHLGRYWLKKGKCTGECAPPIKNGHCYMHWKGCDKPTQHLYHIPTELLKPKDNLLVLFEESTPPQGIMRNVSAVQVVVLHQHPNLD